MSEKIRAYVIAGICIALICIGFALRMFGRSNVSDNGDRADDTRANLQRAGTAQQELTTSLGEHSSQAQDIGAEVSRAQQESEGLATEIKRAGSLTEEGRAIVQRVRARGKTETKED